MKNADCDVGNRTITFAVSTALFADYKTGLIKKRIDKKFIIGLKLFLDKSQGVKIPIKTEKGTFYLIPFKIPVRDLHIEGKLSDKYDTKLLNLAMTILCSRRLADRLFLLGSKDRNTAKELKNN